MLQGLVVGPSEGWPVIGQDQRHDHRVPGADMPFHNVNAGGNYYTCYLAGRWTD